MRFILIFFAATLSAATVSDQQITAIFSSLNALRLQVSALSDDVRGDRSAMLQRTNSWDKKLSDLSLRVDNLDVTKAELNIADDSSRIAAVEAILRQQKADRDAVIAQSKADHDAVMAWIRPGVLSLFGIIASLALSAVWTMVHRRKIEASMNRVEQKSDKAYEEANHYAEREGVLRERQDEQERRLDNLSGGGAE